MGPTISYPEHSKPGYDDSGINTNLNHALYDWFVLRALLKPVEVVLR